MKLFISAALVIGVQAGYFALTTKEAKAWCSHFGNDYEYYACKQKEALEEQQERLEKLEKQAEYDREYQKCLIEQAEERAEGYSYRFCRRTIAY